MSFADVCYLSIHQQWVIVREFAGHVFACSHIKFLRFTIEVPQSTVQLGLITADELLCCCSNCNINIVFMIFLVLVLHRSQTWQCCYERRLDKSHENTLQLLQQYSMQHMDARLILLQDDIHILKQSDCRLQEQAGQLSMDQQAV